MKDTLAGFYRILEDHYGPTGWWPGDTDLEVIVGAVLTQNTAWTNVEKALENLKRDGNLTFRALVQMPERDLAQRIRPSGYFNIKAKRLKALLNHIHERYGGDLRRMRRRPLPTLRKELLAINGIGPETADSILLYALGKTTFVVDAYTRRILSRHGLTEADIGYEELKGIFETRFDVDRHFYKEFHALLVYLGKDFCRKVPRCEECPVASKYPPVISTE